MDLSYPPEAEEFRTEIRAWLEENLPEGWGTPGFRLDGDERKESNSAARKTRGERVRHGNASEKTLGIVTRPAVAGRFGVALPPGQ